MSGKFSKRKGSRAERQAFKTLSILLGYEVKRRLGAARSGGDDSGDVPGWSIEVKRVEKLKIKKWWKQTVEQSERYRRKPVLIYRQSRESWRAVIRAMDLRPRIPYNNDGEIVTISLEEFATLVQLRAPHRLP